MLLLLNHSDLIFLFELNILSCIFCILKCSRMLRVPYLRVHYKEIHILPEVIHKVGGLQESFYEQEGYQNYLI